MPVIKSFLSDNKKKLPLILAGVFVVAFFCSYLCFRSAGVGIFGPKSILISDMSTQYIDFFMGLRSGDVFYTNGIGLSDSFAGSFAYYLSSPFSLLVFLFSKEKLQTALLLIILLKLSFAALSFCYMQTLITRKIDISLFVFPFCYSLMSFVFFFFINLFWLDALIWLPLLILSVIRLIDTGKSRFLPLQLGILFVSNFYISYIVGLFLSMFFLVVVVSKRFIFKRILYLGSKLLGSAVIAAGIAAVILLPAIKDIVKSSGADVFSGYDGLNFTAKQFFLKLFPGSYDSIGNFAAPTIFCGMLVFILSGGFFFLKSIKFCEKIAFGVFIILMLISFLFPSLDSIWHVFSFPNAFAYRYAFCFSFLLLYLSIKTFMNLDNLPAFYFLLWLGPLIVFLLLWRRLSMYLSLSCLLAAFFSIALYICLLLILRNPRHNVMILCSLLLINLFELTFNGAFILKSMQLAGRETSYPFPEYSALVEEHKSISEILEYIPDHKLYRIANTDQSQMNTGISMRYNGVSLFSSVYSYKSQLLFHSFGYGTGYKSYWYKPGNPKIDSLFGIRYILTKRASLDGYDLLAEKNDIFLYENPNDCSILLPASNSIKSFVLSDSPSKNIISISEILLTNRLFESENITNNSHGFKITTANWEDRKINAFSDTVSECVLVTSLPYDKNYRIRIDGIHIKTYEVLGALLAADLPGGQHEIEIYYIPKEVYIGAIISVLSVSAWAFSSFKKREKRFCVDKD